MYFKYTLQLRRLMQEFMLIYACIHPHVLLLPFEGFLRSCSDTAILVISLVPFCSLYMRVCKCNWDFLMNISKAKGWEPSICGRSISVHPISLILACIPTPKTALVIAMCVCMSLSLLCSSQASEETLQALRKANERLEQQIGILDGRLRLHQRHMISTEPPILEEAAQSS